MEVMRTLNFHRPSQIRVYNKLSKMFRDHDSIANNGDAKTS